MFFNKVVATVSKSGTVLIDCNHIWLRNPSSATENRRNRSALVPVAEDSLQR
jgi:hypothetical protein